MAKQKKKRNKSYRGDDAASQAPTHTVIHKVTAVDRSPVVQWWFEKKRVVRISAIAAAVVVFVGWLVFELIRIVT